MVKWLNARGLAHPARRESPPALLANERCYRMVKLSRLLLWFGVLASGTLLGVGASPARAQAPGATYTAPTYAAPAPTYAAPAAPTPYYGPSAYTTPTPAYALPAPRYAT